MHPTPSHFILEVFPKVGIVTTCEGTQKGGSFPFILFWKCPIYQKNYDGPIKLAPCKNKI
jgi:hypothetical protein